MLSLFLSLSHTSSLSLCLSIFLSASLSASLSLSLHLTHSHTHNAMLPAFPEKYKPEEGVTEAEVRHEGGVAVMLLVMYLRYYT